MLDLDTFLTTVYCVVDDTYQTTIRPHLPPRPGPACALSDSEVLTLALLAQWNHFPSERAFLRWAQTHLRSFFPHLLSPSRFNRRLRALGPVLGILFRITTQTVTASTAYRVLDATPVPVCKIPRWRRSCFRGEAALSWCAVKQEWYFGFKLFLAVTPDGVITSAALVPANVGDRPGAESLFVQEQHPVYIADKGFCSVEWESYWAEQYGVTVLATPFTRHKRAWPEEVCHCMSRRRQIVEDVFGLLKDRFGLERVGAVTMPGLVARIGAKLAAFSVAQMLNARHDRSLLAFATLCAW